METPTRFPDDLPPPPGEDAGATGFPRRRAVVIVAALLLLVGGGAAAALRQMAGSDAALLDRMPAGTDLVVVAHLDPSAGQKLHLFRILGGFPALGAGPELGDRVAEGLDEALREVGLTHRDLDWAPNDVGIGVDFDVAAANVHPLIVVGVDDEERARAAMEKAEASVNGSFQEREHAGAVIRSVEGELAWALHLGALYLAPDADVIAGALDATAGDAPSLADSADLAETMSALPADNLGFLFVAPRALIKRFEDEIAAAGTPGLTGSALGLGGSSAGLADLEALRGIGATMSAGPEGIAIDTAVLFDPDTLTPEVADQLAHPDTDNATLAAVPTDSFAVLAQTGFDRTLEQLERSMSEQSPDAARALEGSGLVGPGGLLESLDGDLAIEVGPGRGGMPGAALLLGVTDEAAAARQVERIAALVGEGAIRWDKRVYRGARIMTSRDPSVPVSFAAHDGVLVVASDIAEIHDVLDTVLDGEGLPREPRYLEAVASLPGTESVMYLDVAAVVGAVRDAIPPRARTEFEADLAPNLESIRSLAVGSASRPDRQLSRILIAIPQEE